MKNKEMIKKNIFRIKNPGYDLGIFIDVKLQFFG